MLRRFSLIVSFLLTVATQSLFCQKSEVDIFWGNGLHSLCFKPVSHLVDSGSGSHLGDAKKMWGTTLGGMFNRYFQSGIGYQTGIRFYLYRTKALLDSLDQVVVYDAVNNMECVRSTHYHNWCERQTNGVLALPIGLCLEKPISDKMEFVADGGVELVLPIFSKYKVEEGNLTVSGYYEDYDVEFTDMPIHNFASYSARPSGKFDLKAGLNVYADAGFRYNLGRMGLTTALYVCYGLTDVHKDTTEELLDMQNNYSGLLNTGKSGAVHPLALGLKIGVTLPLYKSQ